MTNNNWIETIKLNVQYDEAELGCNWSLDELINFIYNLLTEKEKDGYQKGITDRTIWNGVYNIGAKEEREKCNQEHKAELERIKGNLREQSMIDGTMYLSDALSIIDRHINSLSNTQH